MDGVGGAYNYGFGVGISSTSRATITSGSADGTLNADSGYSNNAAIYVLNSNTGSANRADVVSLNSDGFTLNALDVSSTIISKVQWLSIGGSDLTNVSLVTYQSNTTTGSQALTGAGFAPDAAIVFTAGFTTPPPDATGTLDTFHGLGYAAKGTPITQGATGVEITQTVNSERRSQSTSNVIYLPDQASMRWEASVSSFGTDGITLNWTTVQSTAIYFFVLYMKGPKFKVVSFNQPAATGSQSITGVGFQPSAGLFTSFCAAATTGQVADGNWGSGVGVSSTKRGWVWSSARSGNNNSSRGNGQDGVIACYTENSSTPTFRSKADLTSWDSDGFTLSWTVSEATARQVIGLLVGPVSAPPPGRITSPLLITREVGLPINEGTI
jgi:hypothetical protein